MKFLSISYYFRKHCALKLLKKHLKSFDNLKFLEIGAGHGDFSITLAKKKARGDILDFSSASLNQIKVNIKELPGEYQKRLKCIKGNFLNYRSAQKYNLIILMEVLEHIKDDIKALKILMSFLAKSGIILLTVPANSKKFSDYDRLSGHYRRYDLEDLKKKCEKAGLIFAAKYNYGFPFRLLLDKFNIIISKNILKKKDSYNIETQTKSSSVGVNTGLIKHIIGMFVKYAFLPLANFIQSFFYNSQLGSGWVFILKNIK